MTHRNHLPQLDGDLFITDGGIETTLIFHNGLDLPLFAAFDLLKDDEGTDDAPPLLRALRGDRRPERHRLHPREPDLAREPEVGGRARLLGRGARRSQPQGDRADGGDPRPPRVFRCADRDQRLRRPGGRRLQPAAKLTAEEAEDYHSAQIGTFADTAADMVTAVTMTYSDEAIGVARAAAAAGMPVSRSTSRLRPTAACRARNRWAMRSRLWWTQRTTGPPTSASTARTRRISTTCSRRPESGASGSGACARTRRPRAMQSSTRRPSSTRATPRDLVPATRSFARFCRT